MLSRWHSILICRKLFSVASWTNASTTKNGTFSGFRKSKWDTKGCVLLTHSRLCLDVTDSVYDLLLWCLLLNWSKTSPECCCSQWTQTDLQPALSCAINSVLIRDVQNRFLFLFGFQKNLDERFLSAPWMQTLLVFVTFSLSCAFRGTVSVGKPSEWMSSFWTIHFF